MRTDELDYHLPEALIATQPAEPRDAARLLHIDRAADRLAHRVVRDLPDLLRPGDLMILNESRVIPARFTAIRAGTGGRVGGLYLDTPDPAQPQRWRVMLEARGRLMPGETLTLNDRSSLTLLDRIDAGEWHAQLAGPVDTLALLERIGAPPLPPYIRRQRVARHEPEAVPADIARYNTVYAAAPGSVAAPTAGLHFTDDLLHRLAAQGIRRAAVTLHVGLGTFAPVRTATLDAHDIHAEPISIPPATIDAIRATRAAGGRIICVGTTTVRAIESLPDPLPPPGEGFTSLTSLFIMPGRFTFRFTDVLMTNFHLPRSTLLALVAALPDVGIDRLKRWYTTAIEQQYRFYSYGDVMWLA